MDRKRKKRWLQNKLVNEQKEQQTSKWTEWERRENIQNKLVNGQKEKQERIAKQANKWIERDITNKQMDRKRKKKYLQNKLVNGQKEKLQISKWTERERREN